MKSIVLSFVSFSESSYIALIRIIDLMSKKHEFDYTISQKVEHSDIVFIENLVPKDFPKDLPMPQIILSSGFTYCGCKQNQHRMSWGSLESQIALIINTLRHFQTSNQNAFEALDYHI